MLPSQALSLEWVQWLEVCISDYKVVRINRSKDNENLGKGQIAFRISQLVELHPFLLV